MDLKKKLQEALNLHKKGSLQEAKKIYTEILKKNPNDFNCLHYLGLIAKSNKEYFSAFELISHAIKINPNSSEAYYNLGNVLLALNKINDAIDNYDLAIKIRPDYTLYFVRGNALFEVNRLNEALRSYNEAINLKPNFSEAYNNKGLVLVQLKDFNDAITSYDEAIKINSKFISAKYNRGLALRSLGEIENSIKTFKEIIKIQPKHLQSFYELALIYRSLKNYNLAVNYSKQILKIEPTHNKANLLSIKIRKDICDWACYEKDYSYAIEKINNDEESIGPFSSIVFFDDLALQKKSSEIHTSINYPSNNSFNSFVKYNNHKKIRIAYFSPDFCNHPVSNLIVELIEKHDKSLFEIYGFSLVNRPDDEMTIRLKKAFTKFINVGHESAKNIVQLSRDMEIDISIDLAVYTGQNKSEIFSMRTAPIQINYLGFASTSGANYYDYIVSDSIVIPDDYQKYYNEKILYLDVIYPNDTKRAQVKKIFDRNYFNLPNDCFIFCSINNNYKYNPYMFDSWMKILNKVEDSVLFLRADNALVKENLRKEALARGINPNRLLFSEKLNYSEYLERLSLMDLFLDTYPFNGHSTSCDALWAGLPIITLIGDTYGSRVCASLLCSVKLDSLITYSINDYENLAIKLANEPQELKKLKEILINPLSLDLFNIIKFTKDIEDGYQKIYTRHQADLAPAHIK